MKDVQFKKGVLELCVLAVISKGDCYGYELVETISKNIEISDGTIYPLLRKLQVEGYCETYLVESKGGPPRKYYRITKKGMLAKENLLSEWSKFVEQVDNIILK